MRRSPSIISSHGSRRHANRQFPADTKAARQLLRRYGVTATSVNSTPAGTENQTFIAEASTGKFVLRVYRQHKKTRQEIEREVAFTEWLADRGIPVPRVLPNRRGRLVTEAIVDGRAWQCIVMEFKPGIHLVDMPTTVWRQLARLQARVHLLGLEYATLHGGQRIAPSFSPFWWLKTKLVERKLPRGYGHFDLTCYNLLIQDRRISAILDFDDMDYRPVVRCLFITILRAPVLLQQPELRAAYLREYQRVRPLSTLEQWYLYARLSLRRRQLPSLERIRLLSARKV